jgi:hypothetical protein
MGTGVPKAGAPAKPALISAAGGKRCGFDDILIQDLLQKNIADPSCPIVNARID